MLKCTQHLPCSPSTYTEVTRTYSSPPMYTHNKCSNTSLVSHAVTFTNPHLLIHTHICTHSRTAQAHTVPVTPPARAVEAAALTFSIYWWFQNRKPLQTGKLGCTRPLLGPVPKQDGFWLGRLSVASLMHYSDQVACPSAFHLPLWSPHTRKLLFQKSSLWGCLVLTLRPSLLSLSPLQWEHSVLCPAPSPF
jgi:hypothetical protein